MSRNFSRNFFMNLVELQIKPSWLTKEAVTKET